MVEKKIEIWNPPFVRPGPYLKNMNDNRSSHTFLPFIVWYLMKKIFLKTLSKGWLSKYEEWIYNWEQLGIKNKDNYFSWNRT